jgi:hypothetical protein
VSLDALSRRLISFLFNALPASFHRIVGACSSRASVCCRAPAKAFEPGTTFDEVCSTRHEGTRLMG